MIENLMKVVKSSRKKKGINITIGAVVGFLLSCTAVVGADNYLLITEENGIIKFSSDDGITSLKPHNPYREENTWDIATKIYVNNMILSGTNNDNLGKGYGLKLSRDLGEFKFINNGTLTGAGIYRDSYGIYIEDTISDDTIIELTNNGMITGISTSQGSPENCYGICNNYGVIREMTNNGTIIGTVKGIGTVTGGYSYGIYNYGGTITELTNNGTIIGAVTGKFGYGCGIYNWGTITELINNETIAGIGSSGYGIYNKDIIIKLTNNSLIKGIPTKKLGNGCGIYNDGTMTELTNNGIINGIYNFKNIDNLINTGVVYGDENAVNNNGTIDFLKNYGILATKGSTAVNGTIGSQENYGLDIKNLNGIPIIAAGVGGEKNIIMGYADGSEIIRKMTIKNKSAIDGSDSFNGNESNAILNALKNTYKVIGADDKVEESIINAYGTAVIFEGAGSQLTLSGTIVSGGIDGSDIVTGSSNNNILVLQSGTVDYISGSITQNTIINGNINMDGGDDIVTVVNGTIINGTLDGGTGNDTLNFDSPVARTSNSDGINIHHNISGFENMNINTNVTLFEKNVGDDGSIKDLEVTDVTDITIGANGVLTLRIDSTNSNKHALSTGNRGTIKSENGGKVLLALNGAGLDEKISFGNLVLDGSLVTGSKGNFDTTSKLHTVKRLNNKEVVVTARWHLPNYLEYIKLNKIYHSILSVDELGNFNVDDDEKLSTFLGYLNDIYAGNPYSYSSELSRKSAGMFRDIVTENVFKPEANKWMIYGGLTHVDGGTKDTYYGKGYYTYDIGSSDMDADTKITGAYMLGEYGVSDTLTSGIVIGGNKLKSDLSNGSKVDGSALYLGVYAKKYIGNLKVTAGTGFQYGDYDVDRLAINSVASDTAESVMKYSDNYNDITYDIYLNGRYSHNIGENLFLEPYGTLSYTYIDQDGANEGSKTLAIETDSKSFDYTSAKVGVDLKKVIPHEKGKSTLSAGVSYTKILDGADEEHITGRFKGGSDFDILVAHKNEHSIGVNAKYALELENGVLFDVKGTYIVERDSHNNSGKNRTKGEWIVGTGLGYRF